MNSEAADSSDMEVAKLSTMSNGNRTYPGNLDTGVGGGAEAVGTAAPSSRAISFLDTIVCAAVMAVLQGCAMAMVGVWMC